MNKDLGIAEKIANSSLTMIKNDLHIINGVSENLWIMLAAYDWRDRGNKSYIGGQEELAKILWISYQKRDTSNATQEEVIKAIEKYNLDENVISMFIANPIHTELDFQNTINKVLLIKEIDGLATDHKQGYLDLTKESLGELYFHPTALSVIELLQQILGDLQGKKTLLAWSKGKVWSIVVELLNILGAEIIEYNVPVAYYDLPDDQKAIKITQDIRDIWEEQSYDGFVSAIRGAHMFDGRLFDRFEWPIVDLTTMQDPKTNIVLWWVNINTLKSNKIYIPPVKNKRKSWVWTITKRKLMANHLRALIRQLIIRWVDLKHFEDIFHRPDNSDIIQTIHESY